MHIVPGFNLQCADAAMLAMQTDDSTFLLRAQKNEFYGLYDGPVPVGAVIFEGNVIHVASLQPCGFAVRHLVALALQTKDILFAPIHVTNHRAAKLARGMGFKVGVTANGIDLFWRTL